MRKTQFYFLLAGWGILGIFSTGCSSTPTRVNLPPPSISADMNTKKFDSSPVPNIDEAAVQSVLGLDRNSEELGFAEKPFNTCAMGYGYSSSNDCRREYMVIVHFQLLCRETEGTISRSLSSTDMAPLSDRPVKWNMKGVSGRLSTNQKGYGQIRTIASSSQRTQRLKLSVGNDFLYMRAGEITRVVTPQPWCNP